MKVDVLLFGPPRDAAGLPEEKISIEKGSKLEDLMRLLKAKHGTAFSKAVRGNRSVIILVNGRNPDSLEGMRQCSRTAIRSLFYRGHLGDDSWR